MFILESSRRRPSPSGGLHKEAESAFILSFLPSKVLISRAFICIDHDVITDRFSAVCCDVPNAIHSRIGRPLHCDRKDDGSG